MKQIESFLYFFGAFHLKYDSWLLSAFVLALLSSRTHPEEMPRKCREKMPTSERVAREKKMGRRWIGDMQMPDEASVRAPKFDT